MQIRISTDSTADLSAALIEKYNLAVSPLAVEMGGRSYHDGVDITPEDIYAFVGSGKGVCRTAAINVAEYEAHFASLLESANAVIHFDISSEMSSCYQNACKAAEKFKNVHIIDSRNLSTGIGLLVLEAAERAEKGEDPAALAEDLRRRTAKVEASFVLDTLFYLQKGGRCSSIVALGANLLKLKPCIEVKNGEMGVGKKYRGKHSLCVEQYVRERVSGRSDIDRRRIFITHSGCSPELVGAVREILEQEGFGEILETRAGCTVSTHCGPNTLGVLFLRV